MNTSTISRAQRLAQSRVVRAGRRIPTVGQRLVEGFADDLRALHDAIEGTALKDRYRVWGGLLLGWARDGAILAHDSLDADFAIADRDFLLLADAIRAIEQAGFKPNRRFVNNDGDLTEISFFRHGASFDFFRMFEAPDGLRYFVYRAKDGDAVQVAKRVPAQVAAPFSFLGRTWLKSADHERELRSMYGSWEIPDPAWSYLDGDNVTSRERWHRPDFQWRGGAAPLAAYFARGVTSGSGSGLR